MDPRNLLALAPAFLKAPLTVLLDRLEAAERCIAEMRQELDELKQRKS